MNDPLGEILVQAEGLYRTFPDGQVKALVDVNLVIRRGEYIAIMGPSGSGKSTLLGVVGGLDRPDQGRVLFDGTPLEDIPSLDVFRARNIGFVFQSFFLLPTLTAIENVQIPMFESERPFPERRPHAEHLLEVVGLSHRRDHLPSKLSVGERQRVAIARALANDPPLLLADEPTGNLDTKTTNDVLDLFAQLHEDRGMTLVMITHSEEVGARARRMVRFRDGRIESDAATQPAG